MLDDADIPRLDGQRPLTLEERKQRAAAMACFDPAKRPGMVDCSQHLSITVFFDGTGNNFKFDLPYQKHSNVARLWQTHPFDDDVNGTYRIYIPGLGTPCEEAGEKDFSALGAAFGKGGEARLQLARRKFDEVIDKAQARAGNPRQPIRMINLAVFGFSRGAALARAFAIRIANDCKQVGNAWHYKNHPFRFYFMGLFDTVASVGIGGGAKPLEPDKNALIRTLIVPFPLVAVAYAAYVQSTPAVRNYGHYAWGQDLRIPAMVEQCLHFVAAHEVRDSFPLDSVRDGKTYPPNTHEVVYPGVHSDVGGGYAPGEQARALKDEEKLSQIPLLDMYRAARVAGVPLTALEIVDPEIKVWFAIAPKTRQLFHDYMAATKPQGPTEIQVIAHMNQLYRARAYLSWHASLMQSQDGIARHTASAEQVLRQLNYAEGLKKLGNELKNIVRNDKELVEAMRDVAALEKKGKTISNSPRHVALAQALKTEISISHGPADAALVTFFDYLVHESVAGFGLDFSKAHNWRTIYFSTTVYEAANDNSMRGASALLRLP